MDTSNRRGLARDFSKSDDSLLMHMSFAATWMAYVSNRYRQLHRRSCSVFCCVMCRPRNEETLGDVKKKNSSAARLARSFYRLRRGGLCAGSFVDKSRPPLHSAPSCASARTCFLRCHQSLARCPVRAALNMRHGLPEKGPTRHEARTSSSTTCRRLPCPVPDVGLHFCSSGSVLESRALR